MTVVARNTVYCGIVCFLAALTPSADADNKVVQVEAIVQKYEARASHDLFDDGRHVYYDAVTFKVVTPMVMADKTIRVFLASDSVADNSPWQRPGQRCRFEIDKDLLKSSQLFRGALENIQWVRAPKEAAVGNKLEPIDPDLLASIEKELTRLEKLAESESGSKMPRPSSQVAYYLLAGLAEQGTPMEQLPESAQRVFDVEPRGGVRAKVLSVFADVRVALIDYTIQDESGSYERRTAVMYVQRDGKWSRKGGGAIATANPH